MPQEIGYARVSKTEQHLALQLDALKKRGVVRVFTDKQTGVRFDRKAFLAAIAYLNEGDTLVVWKLDRLGRSLQQAHRNAGKIEKPEHQLGVADRRCQYEHTYRYAVFPAHCDARGV